VLLNPREIDSFDWDDKLTLEFCGPTAAVRRLKIEPVTVPTVFLAGDSTVTDQNGEPAASWGQMLPRFFKPEVSVANHAESGETLKSFLTEHRLDKLLSGIKPGDWLLIQFGHNDQKTQWPQTYVEAATTYRDYLRAYAGEARRRGATPVLVTSMHRRKFDTAGKIVNTLGDYPQAVRDTAKEFGVPLIDLHAMSAALYEALGPDQAPKAFNDGGKDATHHNNYGAYQLARCVVEGIQAGVPDLAAHLATDLPPFDPAKPPSPDTFILSPSAARSQERPRGN
jgi:lysophospholipase L1-like esterase